jgi:MFS family permease
MLWAGATIAYFSGILVSMMTLAIEGDDHQKFKWSMLAMVGFGFGQITGCFFIGMIVDRFGSKMAILSNVLIAIIMFGITLAFIDKFEFNSLAWAMCFLWGFQDAALNTEILEVIGFEFDNESSEPFSVYNILQSLSCIVFQLVNSAIKTQSAYLYYTVGLAVFALVANSVAYFFPFREVLANKHTISTMVSTLIGR